MIDTTKMAISQTPIRLAEWAVFIGSGLVVVLAIAVGTAIYLKPPPVLFAYVESPGSEQGEMTFRRQSCYSCHEVFGNGASYGPDLDGVGSLRTRHWLQEYMRNPRPGVSAKPYRLRMPSYAMLGNDRLNELVSYLQGLRQVGSDGRVIEPPVE